ncbi:MAG: sigma-E processing peptidase SpoIIGA [Oscillospiraceae bacterium]
MVVYVDVLVILNIFINYFLLLASSKILRLSPSKIRLLLGAFIGGFYSLVIFLPQIPNILSILMNLLMSIILVFIVFNPKKIKSFLKGFSAFFAINFVFAGLMLAVWLAFKPNGMVYNNNAVYFNIDIKILVVSTIVCYGVIAVFSYLLKRKSPDNALYDILIENKGRLVMTKALFDTGNMLSDGFSSTPIIVAEKRVVRKVIDSSLNDFFDGNTALSFTNSNIRIIPFSSVGGDGALKATIIEKLEIPSENIRLFNILIAESKKDFSSDEYSVLIGPKVFEKCD